MIRICELLLNLVVHAGWQIFLIVGVACLGAYLLRNAPARYRYVLWVAALVCSLFAHTKFLKLAWIAIGLTMALTHLARAGEMRPVDLLGRRV